MEKGMTKQINIFFKFDELGNVIKGDKEETNDSRFLGVTFFNEYGEKSEIEAVKEAVKNFEAGIGRQPRILVAKMGQDGHDR